LAGHQEALEISRESKRNGSGASGIGFAIDFRADCWSRTGIEIAKVGKMVSAAGAQRALQLSVQGKPFAFQCGRKIVTPPHRIA